MTNSLTDRGFTRLRALVYTKSGIHLHEGKRELVRSRLTARLRALGVKSFEEYCDYLAVQDDGAELVNMLNAISTNKTSFFREKSHFDFLESEVYPELRGREDQAVKLRIWSAGCSSGEEPYSLAISILEYFREVSGLHVQILATDISTQIIEQARQAIYPASRIASLPVILQRRYFKKGVGAREGLFQVKAPVRRLVTFKHQNLMERALFIHPFDAIFCRNVMIYFDKKTQESLVSRFYSCLKPGGYLFIGHSESLSPITHSFRYIKPSIYRK
ncbi:MAG: protein-glutamate O-methyltransferase CheR [Proteobacteria bacterium]|nr:protein-glutamate O-methyltransferase CheR [Pseudomonadota bacterium]